MTGVADFALGSRAPAVVREFAACAGSDPEMFHPERGDYWAVVKAKRVCASCPVRQPCLDWAVETNQQFGIFGGLGYRDRKKLRRGKPAPNRKYSPEQVIRIRLDFARMWEMREADPSRSSPYKALAGRLGISMPTLIDIVTGRTYADVGGPIHRPGGGRGSGERGAA